MDVGQCRPLYIIYLNAYDLACNEAVDGLVIYYIILQQYMYMYSHTCTYMYINILVQVSHSLTEWLLVVAGILCSMFHTTHRSGCTSLHTLPQTEEGR